MCAKDGVQVVSASPLRLDLRILCTRDGNPVRKNLDIWPTFPIHIEYFYPRTIEGIDEDNLIAALERPDRVSSLCLGLSWPTGPRFRFFQRFLRKMVRVMQAPFPALTYLFLSMVTSEDVPVLPSEFLGRSAPRLQKIELINIPFPALPVLLSSTSHLVKLYLVTIPQTGYIPPEVMVAALATLESLEDLGVGFQSPASRPNQIRLPPMTRIVLPALTSFKFRGVREYLEDFVARISAPRLHKIWTSYFNQLVDFEVPQIWQFIDRSENLNQPRCCLVNFQNDDVSFGAGPTTHWHITESESFEDTSPVIYVRIGCKGLDWQVSHLAQALNQISAVLSNILHFAIDSDSINTDPDDMDDIEWLQLLRPFSSAQTLFVSKEFAGQVSHVLENTDVTMANEVLPVLDMLCLEGQPMTFAHKFIAARWESGHPVTTVDTERAFRERLESYS